MLLKRNLSSKVKNSQNSAMSDPPGSEKLIRPLALGLLGQVEEVDVFQSGIDGAEAVAGRRVGVDANFVASADQVSRDDVKLSFDGADFVVGGDDFGPDLAIESRQRVVGRSFEQKFARGDDGHAG